MILKKKMIKNRIFVGLKKIRRLVYPSQTMMMKIENYNMMMMVVLVFSSISFLDQSNICLGNLIAPEISKHIDPLPPIDHSEINYASFEKNFYAEHEEIRNLSNNQVNELRHKLGVNVIGKFFVDIQLNFGSRFAELIFLVQLLVLLILVSMNV